MPNCRTPSLAWVSAGHGGKVIANFGTTMNEMSDSAGKIIDIIGLIGAIAFQSDIFALDAAVEAARASGSMSDRGGGGHDIVKSVKHVSQIMNQLALRTHQQTQGIARSARP